MKISQQWIDELVPVGDIPADELAEKMSRTGIEVDGVENIGAGLKKIVVGHVESVDQHPDADKLHVCQIDVGLDEPYQIVCGAPNIAVDQKVIVALPGSRIKDNVKIKKGKLRGVESKGMVCSLGELGFSENVVPKDYADGIYVLPQDAPVGDSVIDYLALDDPIIELDITPNRADALSMRGTAYELAAVYDKQVSIDHVATNDFAGSDLGDALTLSIESTDQVPAYYAYLVENVQVKESPLWMQVRLMKAGIRPLNNIVDITNYVLLEYGQPLHAFDYDKLANKAIHTRMAKDGEVLKTLDEVERKLSSDDIVITDGENPVALAGVMGGFDTEISNDSQNVLIEAACFNPSNIRKTARKFGLRSESSLRNERGINQATIAEAGAYAAQLMAEYAGGQVNPGRASEDHLDLTPVTVSASLDYINGQLGTHLTFSEIEQVFAQLDFSMTGNAEQFVVEVPSRRWDISIPADLVEEVARIYGYDKIPASLPAVNANHIGLTPWQSFKRHTNRQMQALGFNQVIAYSLTSADKKDHLPSGDRQAVELDFPMSDDRRYMRTNLAQALLDVAQYNTARQNKNVAIYEVSRVFSWRQENELPEDETHLSAVWTGNKADKTWDSPAQNLDFYDMKAVLTTILDQSNRKATYSFRAKDDLKDMHPGQTAEIWAHQDNQDFYLGYLGKLHPSTADDYDLKDTFLFEISLETLFGLEEKLVTQSPLAKYPGSSRDIAMVVAEDVTHADIITTIGEASQDHLHAIHLFDLYRGENIGSGKKSMAYRLDYLDPEATLTDDRLAEDVDKITQALESQLNAEIR